MTRQGPRSRLQAIANPAAAAARALTRMFIELKTRTRSYGSVGETLAQLQTTAHA